MGGESGLSGSDFTLVALDLPGYGRSELMATSSRPSGSSNSNGSSIRDCEPTMDYFELCADVCRQLMQELGFKTYSVGGWNDGARVAALLAIKCQARVNSLLLWGFAPVMDEQSCLALARARDTSIWEPSILRTYADVYGEQGFGELWRKYVDFVVKSLELPDRFDIRDRLRQIKCPTLVLHGSEDPIISFREHVRPIEMQIYDSEVRQLAGLAHNIHQAAPKHFNELLARFVASASA